METIEERAKEYAHQYRRDAHDLKGERADAAFAAYCQGAEDERKELTRWHDPKKTSPNNLQRVLVKYKKDGGGMGIAIATYHRPLCTGNGTFAFEAYPSQNIIGWRPIHE